MIGIVIVSHSIKLAEGVKELISQMGMKGMTIETAGGTSDGRLGTDALLIESAVRKVLSDDGVIIFYDLGSSLMSTEMALENMTAEERAKIHIMHAPMVEGAFIAAVDISINRSIYEIMDELKSMKSDKSEWQ